MKKKSNIKLKIKQVIKKYHAWEPPKLLVVVALLLPIVVRSFYEFNLDNDFWFLINTGKYILTSGFPHIEPFTIHSDLNFIAQQWLTDIIFYKIYNNFSIYGMYIFTTIFNIIITILLYKVCLLISDNKRKLSLFTTILVVSIIQNMFIVTRPYIFDIVLILLELYLLELYIKKDNKKYLLGLPIISVLMINLHASMWLMIFVMLLPYYLGRINTKYTTKEKYELKPIIIVTIIMLLLGLVNPYGINSITYLFNSYGVDYINSLVGEMKPLVLENNITSIIIYAFIFIILISYYIRKTRILNIRYLLLFLGTLYLTLSHYRGLMFLGIASVFSLSYNLKDYCHEENSKVKKDFLNEYILPLILLIFFVIILVINIEFRYEDKMALSKVATYLDNNEEKDIRIYTSYNDGGYLEYRGYRCYLDPRAEVFIKTMNKKEDILLEYSKLQSGIINYKDFLNKYNFDYLLLESDILNTYIGNETNYRKVYEVSERYSRKERKYILYKNVGKKNEKDS